MKQGLVQSTGAGAGAVFDHPGIMPAALEQDADAWAILIAARWRASIENIFDTGRMLIAAKAKLPHGEFTAMLETKLPFKARQAQMLMAIAADARLSNPQYVALLPASWGTVYDLTRVADDELERGFREQIIRPDMERAEVALLRPQSSDGGGESTSQAQGGNSAIYPNGRRTSQQEASQLQQEDRSGAEAFPVVGKQEREGVAPLPSETQMPGGGLAIAHRRNESDDDPREFFPTPPWATRALIERVLRHLNREGHCKFQNAWEPACGEGHMAEVLREYFREVAASDAYDYQYRGDNADIFKYDFLTGTHASAENFDWVITNPPFRRSTDFVLKAISLARTGVAMFVRLSWIEGVTRYEKLLRDNPPSLLSIFTERAPLHKARWEPEGSTFTAYAWLVWIKGMPAQPPFWIPPGCRQGLAKPEDIERFGKSAGEEAA